jgi:proline dehydrogenase
MPKIVDASLEFQLLEEAQKLFVKLARLKASLCAADALCDQRINTAADREIEHYRARHPAAHAGRDDTTATRAPLSTADN